MIDMRMPFTFGHSRAVASLTEAACRTRACRQQMRAGKMGGLAHDIGELAVPVVNLDAGHAADRAGDRRHPSSPLSRRAGACVVGRGQRQGGRSTRPRHHERLDGTGYHRYAKATTCLPPPASSRLPKRSRPRARSGPHRAAMSDVAAAAKLRAGVKDGKLCTEAVEAVLTAAGQPARRASAERLAGLTPREIEVLRLIAAGSTAKEAARRLDIAPKTADNHIQSLYSKIGVKTRAGAALYALERRLVN